MMREQPLGVLHSVSPRGLHENVSRSWRGMEDAHLKIPKHFLLDGCVHQSYQILRLGFLYSGYIMVFIYVYYIYMYTSRARASRVTEVSREGRTYQDKVAYRNNA